MTSTPFHHLNIDIAIEIINIATLKDQKLKIILRQLRTLYRQNKLDYHEDEIRNALKTNDYIALFRSARSLSVKGIVVVYLQQFDFGEMIEKLQHFHELNGLFIITEETKKRIEFVLSGIKLSKHVFTVININEENDIMEVDNKRWDFLWFWYVDNNNRIVIGDKEQKARDVWRERLLLLKKTIDDE